MTVVLSFPQYQKQAQQLATELQLALHMIDIHHFPDRESRVTLPITAVDHAIIYCGLEYPNDKLVELLFAVETLKANGCTKISLVAPYLCYMRQDIAFHQGEAISQQIIGQYLSTLFDDILSFDVHLHRTASLDDIFPNTNTVHMSATSIFSDFIKQKNINAILLGPDEESLQWVTQIAEHCQLPYATASKTRVGDKQVTISLPEYDFDKKDIVLIDDVISSGGTLIEITRQLKQSGANNVYAMATHVLCDDPVLQQLTSAGIAEIWSSDSVPHSTNSVTIVDSLAIKVKSWIN